MDVKPMDTAVVEIAEDGETAKGIWYSRGTYNDVTPQGPVAFWDYAVFACDFVRENDQWKVLNMLRLSDIVVPGGKNWGKNYDAYSELPEFQGAKAFCPRNPTFPLLSGRSTIPADPLRPCLSPRYPIVPLPKHFLTAM